jgi:hypothetical protein
MKVHFVNLIFLTVLLLSACGKKEKECGPRCQVDQFCDDGVCKCRDDQFALGYYCIDRCSYCFEGTIPCGCNDRYIIMTDQLKQGSAGLISPGPGPNAIGNGSTSVRLMSENKYKFLIPKYCTIDGKKCTHLEVIMDNSDSTQLKLVARYLKLPDNDTLAVCNAVFTR